jgi:hypothetical protein
MAAHSHARGHQELELGIELLLGVEGADGCVRKTKGEKLASSFESRILK